MPAGFLAATALATPVRAADGGASVSDPDPVRVGEGVYMVPGARGEPTPANRGRVGNAGFIVGPKGVLMVEAGVSRRHGEALLDAVAKVTPLPVRTLVITHARQEFLLGAAAMRERGIPVGMHERAAALMMARCDHCLQTLRKLLGGEEMAGSVLQRPERVWRGTRVDTTIGRPVRLIDAGDASSPGDLAVLDERSGVLFAGGLAENRRIPEVQDMQDTRPQAWLEALDRLQALLPQRVVPGHGPAADGIASLRETGDYLRALDARLERLVRDGVALSEVPDAAALPLYSSWDQIDTIHRRNASVRFVALERAWLFNPESAPAAPPASSSRS